ncbi:MAG: hypothetical protein IJY26_00130, partial [Clostridia bacterium]|nr:hypothetical protein [Clostridia bacterium]
MDKDTINEREEFFTESETAAAAAEAGAGAEAGAYQAESFMEREPTAVNGKKCSACGDNLQFDPTSGRLKCRSCGMVQDIFVARGEELDFATLRQGDKSWVEETHV